MQLRVLALQTNTRVLVPRYRVHIDVLFSSIQFYCRCLCFYVDMCVRVCVCVCICVCIYIYIYIQGVSGGIVNILGGDSMDYSE
jgi:hypothetical protein